MNKQDTKRIRLFVKEDRASADNQARSSDEDSS
jgi:hypothetical protein